MMKLTQKQVGKYFIKCDYTDGWDFAIICAFFALVIVPRYIVTIISIAHPYTGQGQMQVVLDFRWLNVNNT